MKKKVRFAIVMIASIVIFCGIYVLYGKLKKKYAPDQFVRVTMENNEKSVQTESSSEEAVMVQTESEEADYTAPDFTVTDSEGKKVKLSDLRGKPVVINFWATWCRYCKEEMPEFNKAFRENPDIQFMMVNVTDGQRETRNSAEEYLKKEGYEFPVYYDTTMVATFTYGASGLPMTVFINKKGELITYANGMLQQDGLEKGLSLIR